MSQILLETCKKLYKKNEYKKIRELIENQKIEEHNDEIYRELAKAYYLDNELNFNFSSKEALLTLKKILEDTNPQETFRLKGAIYKRLWWKSDKTNKERLIQSIENYKRAIGKDDKTRENDKGYATFNFAYLELHKYSEEQNVDKKESISTNILKIIEDDLIFLEAFEQSSKEETLDYWFYVTVAQLYCIKKDYKSTKKYLEKSEKFEKIPDREKAITFQHILEVLYLIDYESNKEFDNYLKSIFFDFHYTNDISQDISSITNSLTRGKLGIALSGGGFRASLFHLGILARLAELDMLRSIETISAVSGGSIIAMHYYLKLKNRLEKQVSLSHKGYIDLVEELKNDFLTSIQENIRVLSFTNFKMNMKMIKSDLFDEDYTRTSYLGELYLDIIYKEDKDLMMEDIKIYPLGKDGKNIDNFHPHYDNYYRSSKIPNLIINSTNLNSGHNWRITASGMGELETMTDTRINKNKLYKYQKYIDFKSQNLKEFRVCDAVASSSAVPGLFEPIVIDTEIENEKIKISDGGVYDNQGLQSLLDDNCDLIICSDASGYFKDEENPSSNKSKIFMRMTDNLMDVTRRFQYKEIEKNIDNDTLRGFEYFHLKKELPIDSIDLSTKETTKQQLDNCTSYEINEEIQNQLSKIRTDLDSFSDIESFSLMTSGYCMAKYSTVFEEEVWKKFQLKPKEKNWLFLDKIKDLMKEKKDNSTQRKDLFEHLENGGNILFKIKRYKGITFGFIILPLLIILGVLLNINNVSTDYLSLNLNISWIGFLITSLTIILFLTYLKLKFKRKPRFQNLILNILLGTIGYGCAKFYLYFLNNKYNGKGKINKL